MISDLNGAELTGSFYEKELEKISQEKFRIGKVLKRKGDKLYAKLKGYDNSFNSWIDKKRLCIKTSQYFPKPFRSFRENINVKVDLSNYTMKTDLKNVTHVDTSNFALKTNSASLKTEVDKLDIDKLASVPVDLSKLNDVVKNVVKKAVYDKITAKVNDIDTSKFVLKTKYQIDKTEKKIPGVTNFVKKTKLTELENKIPDVSSLATKTALTAVENKIPSVSNLVKKTDYNTKITEIEKKLTDHNHDKYITTPEFNTLAVDGFNASLAQANIVTETDFEA